VVGKFHSAGGATSGPQSTRIAVLGRISVRLVVLLPVALVPASPAAVAAGLPGFAWGELRTPASRQPEEQADTLLEGAVEQGYEWRTLGPQSQLRPFGRFDYKIDTAELDYNNKLEAAVGIKLRYRPAPEVVIDGGAKYVVERRMESERHEQGVQAFVDWYGRWRPMAARGAGGGDPVPLAYPGLTWGQLRYPSDQVAEEQHNTLVEGAIEQGVDWTGVGRRGNFNTFTKLEYSADREGFDYNNKAVLGLGVKLRFEWPAAARVQLGVQYVYDYRWISERTERGPIYFLNWSAAWDAASR
jgi:hypothetical protein